MAIEKDEVKKIAHAAHIALDEREITTLIDQLEQVVSYAKRVQQGVKGKDIQITSTALVNVLRNDEPGQCNAQAILERAPEVEGRCFVVPLILEGN